MNKDKNIEKTEIKAWSIAFVIYWFLYPFRNSYKNKLRALLEGLETRNVEKLLKVGKTGDFRNYGKAYISAVRDKVERAKETSR